MSNEIPKQQMDDHARLRAVLDTAVDGIITIDERGVIEAANAAAEQLFGYTASEVIGQNVKILMPSPYRNDHDSYLANYLRTGEQKIIGSGREVEGRRKDGSTFPLYLAVSEVSFGHRRVFTGFVHDLSDLKRAEEEASQLGHILEDSLNEIFVFDAESLRFVFVNRGASKNMGYTANEMFLLTPVDIKPDFSRQQFEELIRPLATGESGLLRFETIHQRKDSSTYHVSIRLQTAIWKGRAAFVAIVLDVSDQVHVREELAERDEQLQFMVDHLPGAAAYADHESGELRFNPMIGEITGYIPKELNTLDAFFSLLFGGDPRPREQYESFRLAWTDDEPLRLTIRRKDDQLRTVEFRGYGYDGHEVWLIHDVTERDRHETELRIRDRAIQAANEGVVIADATREGTPIVFVNRAFEELSGFSTQEAIGRGCELLCGADPDQRTLMELKSAVSGDDDFCRTIRCFRKCGKAFWNELSIAPVRSSDGAVTHIVAVMEDVSERRNAQQQLLQSERLVAIGEMVTGLAHESRNALQRAQACLDMLSLDLEDHPEQLELTEKTTRALNDLHRLYEEVRNYAAPINLERRPTDLKKLWKRTWANLEDSWFGRDFKLVEGHNAASLICNVDEHRIEQVFRNIMENALAACADPGRLTINGSASTIADNDSVSISFRDNGSGLDDETAANIFQPFFTTKQKGTGLGMAISRRVVEAHGGCIRIAQPSSGAEIVVELPR